MTDIDKSVLRYTISQALKGCGIDDLQIEMDICTAVWNLVHDKQAPIGVLNAMAQGATQEQQARLEIERIFRISPNWKVKTWEETCTYVKIRQEKGETVEQFSRWWFENDWRGKTGQPPSANQIRELWPQAFTTVQEELRINPDGSIN